MQLSNFPIAIPVTSRKVAALAANSRIPPERLLKWQGPLQMSRACDTPAINLPRRSNADVHLTVAHRLESSAFAKNHRSDTGLDLLQRKS